MEDVNMKVDELIRAPYTIVDTGIDGIHVKAHDWLVRQSDGSTRRLHQQSVDRPFRFVNEDEDHDEKMSTYSPMDFCIVTKYLKYVPIK